MLNGHPMSKHTLIEYRRMIRHLDEKFGNRSMPDITQGELVAYLNALSSAEVYNKYRSLLVVIYRHAVSEQEKSCSLMTKEKTATVAHHWPCSLGAVWIRRCYGDDRLRVGLSQVRQGSVLVCEREQRGDNYGLAMIQQPAVVRRTGTGSSGSSGSTR